jgi:hypothetical protein
VQVARSVVEEVRVVASAVGPIGPSAPGLRRLGFGARPTPRFVKIWMTPPEASVPYSVAAEAPLITSIRSMSSAAMSWSGDSPSLAPPWVPTVSL